MCPILATVTGALPNSWPKNMRESNPGYIVVSAFIRGPMIFSVFINRLSAR